MFLVLILVLAAVGYAVVTVVQRHHATASVDGAGMVPPMRHFWPSSTFGWMSAGAMALQAALLALVNVVQAPYLGWGLMLASFVCAAIARFSQHDHGILTTVLLVMSAALIIFSALFLLGEVFIGHD